MVSAAVINIDEHLLELHKLQYLMPLLRAIAHSLPPTAAVICLRRLVRAMGQDGKGDGNDRKRDRDGGNGGGSLNRGPQSVQS